MKAVLISIHPKWCELIVAGKKTVEVRKNKPNIKPPFKCYIYETKARYTKERIAGEEEFIGIYPIAKGTIIKSSHRGRGKVIGEFICKGFSSLKAASEVQTLYAGISNACMTFDEIKEYADGKQLYYWHISDLVIYDEPKELNEFSKECPSDNCLECPHSISSDPRYFYEETKIVGCRNNVKRPPQSWCYVEELESE